MFSSSFRERIAVALITLSLATGLVLVVLLLRNGSGGAAFVPSGTVAGANGVDLGASPDASPGDQNSTTTTQTGGGGGTGGGTNSNPTGTNNLSNSQSSSGVTSGTITVGGIFDETGPVDSTVERDTVRAYFDKVNASGGVNGRHLSLIDCDSKYDTNQTGACVRDMIANNVLAIVGWTAPKGEDSAVQTLVQAGIPIIGGLGTPQEFQYSLSYPVSVPFTRYGTAEGVRAKQLGIQHPALVALSDVPWVATVLQALENSLKAQGIQWTDVEQVTSTQADYTQTVANMESNGCSGGTDYGKTNAGVPVCPDGVIAGLDPFSYQRLFQAMSRQNWAPPVLGIGMDKGSVQQGYGSTIYGANGLVPFLSPYDHQSNPTVADYLSTVKEYFPNQYPALDIYTQHSWTAAMVFTKAVQLAGQNLTRETLVSALNSITNFDTGWSKPLSYGSGNHDPNHCFMWMKRSTDPNGTWQTASSDWQCF